jgi:hypothetical protein
MTIRNLTVGVAAVLVSAVFANPACAERVRYHFSPADLCGKTVQTPAGACNAIGERVSYLGLSTTPVNYMLKPTYIVTFRHPFSKQNVTVPLALPPYTPIISYYSNRVTLTYGGYSVDVVFLPDGSVDTIYDSGLFRPLR